MTLVLAGVLSCSMCSAVFAADPAEMEEIFYDEDAFDGEWYSFGGGFDLYLPVDWEDITDQIEAENVTFLMQSEDGSAAVAVAAVDTGLGEEATIDEVADALRESGELTVVDTYYNVNDIYCVGVVDEENNAGYAFLGVDGYCYTVCAGPVTDENVEVISGILNSISATAEE